jgi:hypothetical protein
MPPDMDNSHKPPIDSPIATPGYETRDANVRGVFSFLIVLSVVLLATALVCWAMFRYFSAQQVQSVPASPFADTRQLPLGPQLQVNPREDLLQFREQQEQALETYAWENRSAGIVRVPIERAMELLVKKGSPVQGAVKSSDTVKDPANPAPPGSKKP